MKEFIEGIGTVPYNLVDYTALKAGKDAASCFEARVGMQARTVARKNAEQQFNIWWNHYDGKKLSELPRKQAMKSFIKGWKS